MMREVKNFHSGAALAVSSPRASNAIFDFDLGKEAFKRSRNS